MTDQNPCSLHPLVVWFGFFSPQWINLPTIIWGFFDTSKGKETNNIIERILNLQVDVLNPKPLPKQCFLHMFSLCCMGLDDQTLRVVVNGVYSSQWPGTGGGLQGPLLVPVLYTVLISDLGEDIEAPLQEVLQMTPNSV